MQDHLPVDRQWLDLDLEALTRAGDALVATHPEVEKLAPNQRRQVLQQHWKSLRDKFNRENKISKDG